MRLSTKNFLLNRAARILPALAADIVFAALLIGPLVTTLPAKQYFSDATFFTYFLNVTGWMQYFLPGVFENNPLPEVNGALWTVPFEIGCYVLLAGLMTSGAIKHPRLVLLITYAVLMVGIPLRFATSHLVSDHVSLLENLAMNLFLFKGALLWPSFLIGIVLYQLRYYVPFSKSIAIGLVCVAILVSAFGDSNLLLSPAVHAIILPLLGYLTVTIGLSPMPRLPGFGTGDYSYGLYLYHTPFLQLLIHYFPEALAGDLWWMLFFVGFPLSLTAAVISWHVLEYPVLKLRNSFVIKHRPEGGLGFGDRAHTANSQSARAFLKASNFFDMPNLPLATLSYCRWSLRGFENAGHRVGFFRSTRRHCYAGRRRDCGRARVIPAGSSDECSLLANLFGRISNGL